MGCSQPSLLQMRINSDLKATALQPEDIGSLMKLRAHKLETAADDLRIDLAPYQQVAWMNDLERVRVTLGHCASLMFVLGAHQRVASDSSMFTDNVTF